MPATAAFWTSSKLARPDTRTIRSLDGKAPFEQLVPDELVHGVVAPDVLTQRQQLSLRVEEPGGVQAARRVEDAPVRRAWPSGSRSTTARPDDRPRTEGRSCTSTWSIDALPQIAAARRREEVALEDSRVERPPQLDGHDVEPLLRGLLEAAVADRRRSRPGWRAAPP